MWSIVPVIASQTINIDVKEDRSIEIKFLDELSHKKCINLHSFVSTGGEKEQLHDMVKRLVGEKVIECDNNVCCISENYYSFVDKLNRLKE